MNLRVPTGPSNISVWLVCWIISMGWFARGVDSPPAAAAAFALRHLSLVDAQNLALQRNWDLLAAASGVDAATAQKILAREFPNPTLSLSTVKINADSHPNSTVTGNGWWDRSYDTIVAINQLLEIGGKRRDRRLSAQASYEGAKAQLLDARRLLDLAVAKAYAAAALADENVRVLEQSAATLRQEARLAEIRMKAGEISQADKTQIEIGAERFELDARSAETAAAQARINLEVLLGVRHPDPDCVLTDHLESLVATAPPADTNATVLWRPDVVAAEATWRKAEADWKLQRAYRVPDPTVLAQYEHEPADAPNSVGFGVSFPLPLWNRNRGNILSAAAALEQARLAAEKARAQAAAEMATARLAYDDAFRRWQNYRDSIRPKSDQLRQTKAYAYQKGGASLLDLLVAERDDNDIRLAAMQAAGDTVIAAAAMKAATVQIRPEEVRK